MSFTDWNGWRTCWCGIWLEVKPGDWVGDHGGCRSAAPAARALHRAILQAGGHPSIIMSDEAMEFTLLREGSDGRPDMG